MRQEIREILDQWCWLVFTGGRFRVIKVCSDELLAELGVEDFLRDHYPRDKGLRGLTAADIPEGLDYLLPFWRYAAGYNPHYDPQHDERLKAKQRAGYGQKVDPRDLTTWVEWGVLAFSLLLSRRNYKVLADAVKRRTASGRSG
jgi:hypothetical protein